MQPTLKPPAMDERREGLTLERYAELMAYRRHFPPSRRVEVLLRLGVRPARWAAATRAWGAAMTEALARDEPALALRFAKALGATARRLREFPPRIEDLGEPIDPNKPEPGDHAPPIERPSFMLEDAAPRQPSSGASPWLQPSLPSTGHGAPEARPPTRPPDLTQTVEISAPPPPGRSLPFASEPAGALPGVPRPPKR